ncbi:MAG: hypothetical protein L6Q95_09680 [Planctomycetes bacterium]|nr:hypothetical protein [Planctomycetota bacterium]
MARDRTRFHLAVVALAAACSREQPAPVNAPDHRPLARAFAEALAARDYASAHAMMAAELRKRMTVDRLRAAFEAIVPPDGGPVGPIEVGETMTAWPERQPSDLGWAYVSIGGETFSEALTVVVALEKGEARVRDVQFGRP